MYNLNIGDNYKFLPLRDWNLILISIHAIQTVNFILVHEKSQPTLNGFKKNIQHLVLWMKKEKEREENDNHYIVDKN